MEEEMKKKQRAHLISLLEKVPEGCHVPLLLTFHWPEPRHMTPTELQWRLGNVVFLLTIYPAKNSITMGEEKTAISVSQA